MRDAPRVAGALLAALLSTTTVVAQQAPYPDRPITWVLPSGAGGVTDNPARVIARVLSEKIGQTIVIDNKPGAAGKERGIDIVLTAWASIAMPAGTPPEIVARMSAAIEETTRDPTVIKYNEENDFGNLGYLGPEKLKALYISESEKFKKVVEKAGITLD